MKKASKLLWVLLAVLLAAVLGIVGCGGGGDDGETDVPDGYMELKARISDNSADYPDVFHFHVGGGEGDGKMEVLKIILGDGTVLFDFSKSSSYDDSDFYPNNNTVGQQPGGSIVDGHFVITADGSGYKYAGGFGSPKFNGNNGTGATITFVIKTTDATTLGGVRYKWCGDVTGFDSEGNSAFVPATFFKSLLP